MLSTLRRNPGKSAVTGLGAVLALSLAGQAYHTQLEGNPFSAYADPATRGDPWAICGGVTGQAHFDGTAVAVVKGLTLTADQCGQANAWVAETYREGLSRCVTRPLTQNQSDGLILFAVNVGVPTACASSVVRKVNAGDFDGAAKSLELYSCAASTNPRYPHAHCGPVKRQMPGLLNRRRFEAALLRKPDWAAHADTAGNLVAANARLREDAK